MSITMMIMLEQIAMLLFQRILYINIILVALLAVVLLLRGLTRKNVYLLNLLWLLPPTAMFCYNLQRLNPLVNQLLGYVAVRSKECIIIMLSGIVLSAVIHRIKGRKLRRVMRMAVSCPEAEDARSEAARMVGVRRRIRLRRIAFHAPPFVYGMIKPTIYLPHDWKEKYEGDTLSLVLVHELVHVKQGDLLIRALCNLFRSLFWYNIVLHIALPQLYVDRELLCDAKVLKINSAAKASYGKMILMEATGAEIITQASVGFATKSGIAHRVAAIARFKPINPRVLAAMTSISFAVFLLLSAIYLHYAAPTVNDASQLLVYDFQSHPANPFFLILSEEDDAYYFDGAHLYIDRAAVLAHIERSPPSAENPGSDQFGFQYQQFDKANYSFDHVAATMFTYDELLHMESEHIILQSTVQTLPEKIVFFIYKYV